MHNRYTATISQIRHEFEVILGAYRRLRDEKDSLVAERQRLMDTIGCQSEKIKELESRYAKLTVAQAVKTAEGGDDAARDRIDNLIAEIDACIALLNR
jgi:predicted nuclease with TOPRIM domain